MTARRGGLLSRQESDSCLIKPKRNKNFLLCSPLSSFVVSPTLSSSRSVIKVQHQQRPTFLLEKQCSDSALILPKRTLSPKKQHQQQQRQLLFSSPTSTIIKPPNLHLIDDEVKSPSSTTSSTATDDEIEEEEDGDDAHVHGDCTNMHSSSTNQHYVSPSQAQRYMKSVNFHQLRYHQQYRNNHKDVMRAIRQGLFLPSSATIIETVKEEEPSDDNPNDELDGVAQQQQPQEQCSKDSCNDRSDTVVKDDSITNQTKIVNDNIVQTAREVLELCSQSETELNALECV